MTSSASVAFPSADPEHSSHHLPISPPPTHLPFRRISLPAPPNLNLNRQSVVSLASFESLPENAASQAFVPSPTGRSPTKRTKSRPTSMDVHRKGTRRRELRVPDEERDVKRRRIIDEFYETERTYVQGLDLIYELFLTPIIAALDTPHILLDRADLTSVFSSFIDIWNLHRAFFSSLNDHLHPAGVPETHPQPSSISPPSLSPVLLSHFPYLSLYTPFVTSFSISLTTLTTLLNTNSPFAAFVATQEADPRCGKLKLRDWLLTIVQRCPRYLLLLKDLIACTDADDPEHSSLMSAHALVSKITISLNASLHMHAQTLTLLALQRSTPNLPFQLVAPGRTFLKRGTLLQFERGSFPKERDFLLFSDCLLWIANLDKGDSEHAERWDWKGAKARPHSRPMMVRSRSRSEAELSALRNRVLANGARSGSPPSQPASPIRPSSSVLTGRNVVSPSQMKKRQASSGNGEEKWWFKGKAELLDLEIVVTPPTDVGEETRFEVWSPEGSFAVYAASEDERDEWSTAIRNAKASLLASLNVTHPNSTLSSSASTNHLRRTLQALPHLPEDAEYLPKRGKVEHFVPAVWIPDGKTESCMRCGRTFGWRRRRHHCRLCGRCVCAGCSGSTFFIIDSKSKETGKPARACDACYETVFPVLTPSASPHIPSGTPNLTLSGFPSWQSTPALALARPPSFLMAIDKGSPNRALARIDDVVDDTDDVELPEPPSEAGSPPRPVIRIKPASRPRSFHHILEDFQDESLQVTPSPSVSHFSARTDESTDAAPSSLHPSFVYPTNSDGPSPSSLPPSAISNSISPAPRPEDTVRRQKRFSLPVVGLQTTSVTARANAKGEGLAKRFSLVLGGGRTVRSKSRPQAQVAEEEMGEGTVKPRRGSSHGIAAARLADLLGRRKGA
ncbi:hypothetical protein BC834DRAFT_859463 [Gloeopeniophorella convolvens]|nr:hypothetical protein BC834DRAFT_859463 [Gloeopeniophorella convolvens]